jgi:hypothetical protein
MSAALPQHRAPRTVRLRMAQDTNRAERIRQLKADRPDMTWGYIADHVGVRERSAIEWQRTGGLTSGNAEKLAELFGVSYDYLWFGEERGATPDLLAGVSKLEQVENVRGEFRSRVREINRKLDLIMAALNIRAPETDAPPIVPYPESEPPEVDRRAGRGDRREPGTHPRTGSEG